MTDREEREEGRAKVASFRKMMSEQGSPLKGSLYESDDGTAGVYVAQSAGFCFGVHRAVDTVYQQVSNGAGPIYTYGPIIHNESVVSDLESQGVRVVGSGEEIAALQEGTVVIRSHGVPEHVYTVIRRQGLQLVDATCPFVRKIHRIVKEKSEAGYQIVIIGSESHPEVEGIMGWCSSPAVVIETEEEADRFAARQRSASDQRKPLCIVSQTTFNRQKFEKLVEIITQLRYDDTAILNTICNATEERQTEARAVAKIADAMIVIGGKHSSNTQKLVDICRRECESTFFVSTFDDLNLRLVPSRGIVGISAGASTPNNIIEEVSKQCRKTILLNRC